MVILPCDYYYSPESAFATALESAFAIAEQRLRSVLLLGIEPKSPEVDYGWIEVGEAIDDRSGLFHVAAFREKPSLPLAEKLFRAGSLWNTFVMVGHVCTFLEIAWATIPSLLQAMESREIATSASGEIRIPDFVYARIPSTDFSRQVLSSATDRLLALRLANVEWSDLGDSHRLLLTLLKRTMICQVGQTFGPRQTLRHPAHRSLPVKEYSIERQRGELAHEQCSLNRQFP